MNSSKRAKSCRIKNAILGVESIGINGKMNEFQAAMGLENLKIYTIEQKKRSIIKKQYDSFFKEIKGIRVPKIPSFATNSYQYYPIILEDAFGHTRNSLYDVLVENNIISRKYFFPACSDYGCYNENLINNKLDVTNYIKERVLCLPFYGSLEDSEIDIICHIIKTI